ncbi:MAG: hypothetical protein V2A54_14295 [Bacteroidota bacterium]
MKKVIVLIALLFAGYTLSAQKYFVYDSEEFAVLIQCDTNNTTITSLEYSQEKDWVPFTILGKKNLERQPGSGFIFRVVDKNGNKFLLDYLRSDDILYVTNIGTGKRWKLNRRQDQN